MAEGGCLSVDSSGCSRGREESSCGAFRSQVSGPARPRRERAFNLPGQVREPPRRIMTPPTLSKTGEALLTTFGLGKLRPAPGTWGSLPPVGVAGLMVVAGMGPDQTLVHWAVYNGVLLAILVIFSAACVVFGDAAEARFGKKDPGQICADETAGQCLPLMLLPAHALATPSAAIATLGFAFVTFRIMDILKPWPAFRLQKHPAGWGVLLDDLAAGLQAMIVVQVVARVAM